MNEIYVEQIDTCPEQITEYIKKYSCSLQKYIHQGIPQDDFLFGVLWKINIFGQTISYSNYIKNLGILWKNIFESDTMSQEFNQTMRYCRMD